MYSGKACLSGLDYISLVAMANNKTGFVSIPEYYIIVTTLFAEE